MMNDDKKLRLPRPSITVVQGDGCDFYRTINGRGDPFGVIVKLDGYYTFITDCRMDARAMRMVADIVEHLNVGTLADNYYAYENERELKSNTQFTREEPEEKARTIAKAEMPEVDPIIDPSSLAGTWPGGDDDGFEDSIDKLRHPER